MLLDLLLLWLLVLVLVRLLVCMLLVRVLLLLLLASQRSVVMCGRISLTLRATKAVGRV
jgi:hypothetical protein